MLGRPAEYVRIVGIVAQADSDLCSCAALLPSLDGDVERGTIHGSVSVFPRPAHPVFAIYSTPW
jgi:hypothetical protein